MLVLVLNPSFIYPTPSVEVGIGRGLSVALSMWMVGVRGWSMIIVGVVHPSSIPSVAPMLGGRGTVESSMVPRRRGVL